MAAAFLLETDGGSRISDRPGRPARGQICHIEVVSSFGWTRLLPVHDFLLIGRSRNHD
jgi:hypothetical protein